MSPQANDLEMRADIAAATAHRACCGLEHDPSQGKLHGCCVVCGVPWPCETARYFLRAPSAPSVEPTKAQKMDQFFKKWAP